MQVGISLSTGTGTGIARYARELLGGFSRAREVNLEPERVRAFAPAMRDPRPGWLPRHIEYVSTRIPGALQRLALYHLRSRVEHIFDLRELDLLHITNLLPLATGLPLITTVYDVAWRHFGVRYESITDRAWMARAERAIRTADHICAISQATADDLIDGGIPANKVTVTYLGVDDRFKAPTSSEVERVRTKYSLPDAFVLFVGAINIRKNVATLSHALELLPFPLQLVIAGPPPPEGLQHWALDKPNAVHLGYVPEEDLPALYRAATMLAFPSVFEGFGLPLLEAMAAGVPVVASRIPIFAEIGGPAPVYFDPFDASQLAEAMRVVFQSASLREEMVGRGHERSLLFRWSACHDATVEAYRQLVRGLGR